MKYIFTLLLTAGMAATFAQDEIKLQADEDKFIYLSLFRLIEQHTKFREPIEEELMLLAANDAVNGKPSRVASEDMKALRLRMREKWIRQKKWDRRKTRPTDPEKWMDEEKFSYDAVYSSITSLKKNELFDKAIILQSAEDVFVRKVNRLENEQFLYVWRRLEVKRAVASNFEQKPHARKNWEAGVAYQKANKKKQGVKVTASGLQYRVIKEGTGEKPTVNDTVSITYKTNLVDGNEIENRTEKVKPFWLIQGLSDGLQLMKVDAKYELVIPPELGWAMSPSGSMIPPPCSTMIIKVELLDIVKKK